MIQLEERLLVVRHVRSGKLTIPGGTSEAAESAQCTAHRETWEEAGVAVEVGPLLATLNNGFHLFECAMDERERARWSRTVQAGTACQRPAEVSRVMLVPAADLNAENYRFPRYLGDVKLAVAALPATQGAGAIASALR